MIRFSTRQAAKKLGITHATLSRYLTAKKVPSPTTATGGGMTVHLWTEEEIERIRKLLPKIANGRKTRWERQRAAENRKQTKRKIKTQPRAAAVQKPKKKKQSRQTG